jgi:D-alanyl-D-alanine carboxypeptidase
LGQPRVKKYVAIFVLTTQTLPTMKTPLTIAVLILITVWPSFAQDARVQSKTDSLFQALNEQKLFSGELALFKNDQLICRSSARHLSNGSGVFKVGSVSKVFTSILIHQLFENGMLKPNDKLSTFFPSIPHASDITIAQMLGHTSGIFNITEWEDYYSTRTQLFDRARVLQLINQHKPEFKPGKDCTYSNSNYILLGYIAEDVTKKPFAQLVQENLVAPLQLKNTYFETTGVPHPPRESSFIYDGEVWFEDVDSDPSLPHAAGAMVSTPTDLCALFQGMFDHRLLRDTSLQAMQKLNDRSTGHGIFKSQFNKKTSWLHSGRIDEFNAVALTIPEDSLYLAICSNGSFVEINDILIFVLSAYYGKNAAMPETMTTASIEEPNTSSFTGLYRAKLFGFIPLGKMNITEAGKNCLFLEEGDGKKAVEKSLITRLDAHSFYSKDADAKLIFVANKQGNFNKCLFQTSGITITCKRIKQRHRNAHF